MKLLSLPEGAARHVAGAALQPGDPLTLFNGQGGEWTARVTRMGRSEVQVQMEQHHATERELPLQVTLAIGMPANERMDALVEKAAELGVAVIQPLLCERSVLRLSDERAHKRVAHWRGVAVAACEQSARTRVPTLAPRVFVGELLRTLTPARRCKPACCSVFAITTGPAGGGADAFSAEPSAVRKAVD